MHSCIYLLHLYAICEPQGQMRVLLNVYVFVHCIQLARGPYII